MDAAAERLKEFNPSLDIQTICGDIAYDVGLGLIRRMDVIIGCVDNRWARYCINRLCMRAGVSWVDGGIEALEGTARVFKPGVNCYACNLGTEGQNELRRRFSCANTIRMNEAAGRVPTTPIVASVIGAVQAQEAMKIIHSRKSKVESRKTKDESELTSLCGKMFYYEGQHLTTKLVDFRAYDDDCPEHELWAPVEESELTNRMSVREALDALRTMLRTKDIRISLTADCFVDKLIRKEDDGEVEIMQPKHRLTANSQELTADAYYVNEYYELDDRFPYPELTLAQAGIPAQDILLVHTENEDYYVELND